MDLDARLVSIVGAPTRARFRRYCCHAALVLLAVAGNSAQAWEFTAPHIYSNIATPFEVVAADLNGDGNLDLLVPNYVVVAPFTVSILYGHADGTFAAPVTVDSGGREADGVAVGDLDGDGRPDLVVINQGTDPGTNTIVVLLQRIDGTFAISHTYAFPVPGVAADAEPDAVRVADVNGDGKLDVVVGLNSTATVAVYLGDGHGNLRFASSYDTGLIGSGLAIADFNRDGHADLAVANANSDTVTVLFGKGNGQFAPGGTYPAGPSPETVAAADFNGDGVLDLVIPDAGFGADTVSVLLGRPDGTFAERVAYKTGSEPIDIAVADLNNDGKLDLVVALAENYPVFPGGPSVAILRGNGDGTFQPSVSYAADEGSDAVAVGDFNHDGLIDIAAAGEFTDSISVLLNTGSGCTAPPAITEIAATPALLRALGSNAIVDVQYRATSQCGGTPRCRLSTPTDDGPTPNGGWRVIDSHHVALQSAAGGAAPSRMSAAASSRAAPLATEAIQISCTDPRGNSNAATASVLFER